MIPERHTFFLFVVLGTLNERSYIPLLVLHFADYYFLLFGIWEYPMRERGNVEMEVEQKIEIEYSGK